MGSPELQRYLDFERAMVRLDEDDNSAADLIRDFMDDLWYALSEAERRSLNERELPPLRREIRVPIGERLFMSNRPPPKKTSPPQGTWSFSEDEWAERAA